MVITLKFPEVGRDTILTSRDASYLRIERKDNSPPLSGGSGDQMDSIESSLIGGLRPESTTEVMDHHQTRRTLFLTPIVLRDTTIGNDIRSRIESPRSLDTKPLRLDWNGDRCRDQQNQGMRGPRYKLITMPQRDEKL